MVLMKSINLARILCLGCWFGLTIFDCKCRKITSGLNGRYHNTHCICKRVQPKNVWQNIIFSQFGWWDIPWWYLTAVGCLHHSFYHMFALYNGLKIQQLFNNSMQIFTNCKSFECHIVADQSCLLEPTNSLR